MSDVEESGEFRSEEAEPTDDGGTGPEEVDRVTVRTSEANNYRIINVDGAQGTFTQNEKFFFKLYSEHPAFPERNVRRLTEEGTLGEVIETDLEDITIERVMECGVMVDFETLRELHEFLGKQLEMLEDLIQDQSS